MKPIVIAIDGFSGCGKSTTASAAARVLGYTHIDSGAMYRAVTWYFLRESIAVSDPIKVSEALTHLSLQFCTGPSGEARIHANGQDVSKAIREPQIAAHVSQVSALGEVRNALVAIQRGLGKHGGVVMDGRDIGTHVFPCAELKIFMVADLATRSLRRYRELAQQNEPTSEQEVYQSLHRRDVYDSSRALSPLQKAPDAITLDTTYLTPQEQVDEVVRLAVLRMATAHR